MGAGRPSFIDRARRLRGLEGEDITNWRRLHSAVTVSEANKTDALLRWCEEIDVHPMDLPTGKLLSWIETNGNKQVKAYTTILRKVARYAFGRQHHTFEDLDIINARKLQKIEISKRRVPTPIVDLRMLVKQAAADARSAGSIRMLSASILHENLAGLTKMVTGYRLTDMGNIPWHEIERVPGAAALVEAEKFRIDAYDTKEVLLAEKRGWCGGVWVFQNPDFDDDDYKIARLSMFITEWIRRIVEHLGKLPKPIKHYGRNVYCTKIWIPRSGGKDRKTGKERWVLHALALPIPPDTISNRIQRFMQRAGARQLGIRPFHLRHYFATMLKHVYVEAKVMTMEEVRERMRHKKIETTKQYYFLEHLHVDARDRRRDYGDAAVAALCLEAAYHV